MRISIASLLALMGLLAATLAWGGSPAEPSLHSPWGNCLVVTPEGPRDGGDFGPHTPGTKTSGLQEAFHAAKTQNKGLYIAGGSLSFIQSQPVVYFIHETLHIPWMQDFRLDGGHYVIQYTPKSGDAVVIDSQMSCAYRFGLIVSNADGAVVRLKPATAGPDRFQVITSTEFVFNAIVGGGGAWPGGEAFDSELDPDHVWKGVGLHLDGEPGPIDANKITVLETVGCHVGLLLTGKVTRNSIEETNIHLCQTHAIIGQPTGAAVDDNRIEAFMDSQGIEQSIGVRLFGKDNLLTLSASRMAPNRDVIFEAPASGNTVVAHRLTGGITNLAAQPTNRLHASLNTAIETETPDIPAAGVTAINRNLFPTLIRFTYAGKVDRWFEVDGSGHDSAYGGPLAGTETILLNPGEGFRWEGTEPPQWLWKGVR